MKRKVIALTGGIGSGKSSVARYLRQRGFFTIDCDQLSRQLAETPQLIAQVKQLLGEECIVNGKLDRAKIRNVIFTDKTLHAQYGKLFYNGVKRLLDEVVEGCNQNVVFVEIPVFEAISYSWTEVWLIERSVQSRVASVVQRDNVTEQNVLDIISRQQICNSYTIKFDNNGSLERLYQQIEENLKRLNS